MEHDCQQPHTLIQTNSVFERLPDSWLLQIVSLALTHPELALSFYEAIKHSEMEQAESCMLSVACPERQKTIYAFFLLPANIFEVGKSCSPDLLNRFKLTGTAMPRRW